MSVLELMQPYLRENIVIEKYERMEGAWQVSSTRTPFIAGAEFGGGSLRLRILGHNEREKREHRDKRSLRRQAVWTTNAGKERCQMSAGRALPVKAPAQKKAASSATRRVERAAPLGEPGDDDGVGSSDALPFPSDPVERAALLAAIDKGIEEARTGQDISWEELDARICKRFGIPPA